MSGHFPLRVPPLSDRDTSTLIVPSCVAGLKLSISTWSSNSPAAEFQSPGKVDVDTAPSRIKLFQAQKPRANDSLPQNFSSRSTDINVSEPTRGQTSITHSRIEDRVTSNADRPCPIPAVLLQYHTSLV